MADDVTLPGTGDVIAADEIAGKKYQRAKVVWGPDGTANDSDVATGKPLPIQVRSATGLVPIGEPTDAKSTATDATSASVVSILKQVSASVQALAASAEGTRATYRCAVDGATSASGVALELQGSASKTVRVTRIAIAGTLTTGAGGYVLLTRRSSASTGGTSTTTTIVKNDTNNATATAVVKHFTVVATSPGTSLGFFSDRQIFFPSPSTIQAPVCEWNFGRNAQAIVLRGTSEFLTVSTSSFASYTGATVSMEIEWTEE